MKTYRWNRSLTLKRFALPSGDKNQNFVCWYAHLTDGTCETKPVVEISRNIRNAIEA